MRTNDHRNERPKAEPLPVGSGSRTGRRDGRRGPFDLEFRVRLTPTEARLLRCLPIVGNCVRQWSVPVEGTDWLPHPTVPGVDIQLGAV